MIKKCKGVLTNCAEKRAEDNCKNYKPCIPNVIIIYSCDTQEHKNNCF